MQEINQQHLRNVAIIAHVDHGKTTLVDGLLKQTKTFSDRQKELEQTTILDSNELERERGVTILAKNTAVFWQDYKINILDTPGHADFSGEVERVLNMADGCILLVDASEGVLSQTRFVLRLALELKLVPIVVINKVDRKNQRLHEVEQEVADLFLELATDESQLDFPILYARGIDGVAGFEVAEQTDHSLQITDSQTLEPLFTSIVEHIPAPKGDVKAPLQLQINSLDYDNHIGKIVIGRVFHGTIQQSDTVWVLPQTESAEPKKVRIEHLFVHQGLNRQPVKQASAGEIVALSGLAEPTIGDTIADLENPEALPKLSISEPTVKMQLSINTSPFAGKDAEFSTSRQIKDRLNKELETNVGLRVLPGATSESVTLVGRGELHLAILIETMRREGFEFSLSKPEVVTKEVDGVIHEPWEYCVIEVPETQTGTITNSMAKRAATLKNMHQTKNGMQFEYEISTANLIGYRNELLVATSGEGILNSTFLEYRPLSKRAEWHRGGAVIEHETGKATAYAIEKAQQRTKLLVDPGEEIYAGQVVGITNRPEDMFMNLAKGKKLTNMRSANADILVVLTPAWKPSLEQFLNLIGDDEMLEVTPNFLRLRKKDLTVKH